MAKLEKILTGDFSEILHRIEDGIVSGSVSANLEESSDFCMGDVRCSVRVFERFSFMGNNRVSLSVTLFGNGDTIYISAITSGGSQAVFFKLNTFGEEAFLDELREIL